MKIIKLLCLVLSVLLATVAWGQAQTPKGFYYPAGTSDQGRYFGWLDYNSAFKGYHVARDYKRTYNDKVYAISDGDVVYMNKTEGSFGGDHTAGGAMLIRHWFDDNGTKTEFYALYGHLKSDTLLPVGTQVVAGQEIARVGHYYSPDTKTDRTDIPHLHFGIHLPGTDSSKPCRGYVPSASDTMHWVDPTKSLIEVKRPVQRNPWVSLAGATSKAIATSDTGGYLYFLHRGDDANIYYTAMDSSLVPGAWRSLPGQTDYPLSMMVSSGTRIMAHLGQDGRIYLGKLLGSVFTSMDGSSTTNWTNTGATSANAPSIAPIDNWIWMIHRGSGGDTAIYLEQYNQQGKRTLGRTIPGSAKGRPALASSGTNLWAAHLGDDGTIYVGNQSLAAEWHYTGWKSIVDPSLCGWGGRMYLAHRGGPNNHIYVWSMDEGANGGGTWTLETEISDGTDIQPGLFTFYNHLYVTRVDSNGTMMFKQIK